MIGGVLLSGMVAAGLIGHAVMVAAQGVGVLAERLSDRRSDRLAR